MPLPSSKVNQQAPLRTDDLHAGLLGYWAVVGGIRNEAIKALNRPDAGLQYAQDLCAGLSKEHQHSVSTSRAAVEAQGGIIMD